jgi:carboxymethylenebutenolidase
VKTEFVAARPRNLIRLYDFDQAEICRLLRGSVRAPAGGEPRVPEAFQGIKLNMMMRVLLTMALLVPALAALGAEEKQVTYRSGEETVKAALYLPAGRGTFPALIVIHEWWGLNDWVKQQAAKLADQGYAALAIDLYRGKVAATPEEAHELMRGVPDDRAARDLEAAFDYLAARPEVNATRVGAIGWCMGGGYALNLAVAEPQLRAVVVNYGHLATDPAAIKGIKASALGIFGGQDRGIPVEDVHKFGDQMKAAGKKVQIVIYPNAGHAFQNPGNKAGYRPEDAADAWQKTIAFLAKELENR